MHYLSIDYLIIGAFLLITLIIGLRAGRGIKDIREYAIANKMFGTIALTITYLATNIAGASVFQATGFIFDNGVIITAALLALPFSFLFTAFFIAPHAAKFTDCLTMGDLVGALYGPSSKLIAGFLGLFTTFCIATMELSMLGEVGHSLHYSTRRDIPGFVCSLWGHQIGDRYRCISIPCIAHRYPCISTPYFGGSRRAASSSGPSTSGKTTNL